MKIALITGPAGVGKSTVCWEMGAQLAAAKVAHAVIETDELDRVFPLPTLDMLERICPGTSDISRINLAAVWSTYRALGHTRLILNGVMLHLETDRQWILAAISDAEIAAVRLTCSEATLLARLAHREIGSGRAKQFERSIQQAWRMAERSGTEDAGVLTVPTDDRTPMEVAETIVAGLGWLRCE
jgi:cytidylate kinase